MQASATISQKGLVELANFIFNEGAPIVFQAYSHFGEALREFRSAPDFEREVEQEMRGGGKFLYYSIHFRDALGHVAQRKIKLDPSKCDGHSWRSTVEGWGLIQLQADMKHAPNIACRVAVNSEKRAAAWSGTYPEFKAPDSWDWRVVKRHASRIIRRLKKIAEPPNASYSVITFDFDAEDHRHGVADPER
jgi:hypothetical protein